MSSTIQNTKLDLLLAEARHGSPSGLGSLLEVFRPQLTELAQRCVGQALRTRMSESDLVQETMLTASQRFFDFRGASAFEFQAWLVQILHARLVDGLRRHMLAERRKVRLQHSDSFQKMQGATASPSSLAALNEQTAILIGAVLRLSQMDRNILLLRYVEQLGFEAIAERLSLPVANVWRRWSRSIDRLREEFPDD